MQKTHIAIACLLPLAIAAPGQACAENWGQIGLQGLNIIQNMQQQQRPRRYLSDGDELIGPAPTGKQYRRYPDRGDRTGSRPSKRQPSAAEIAAQQAKEEAKRQAKIAAQQARDEAKRQAEIAAEAKTAELREVQARLNRLNFAAGSADGQPGPSTTSAIMAFQASMGWPETGVPTPPEKLVLVNASDGSQNPNAVADALAPLDAGTDDASTSGNIVAASSTQSVPALAQAGSSLPEPAQ